MIDHDKCPRCGGDLKCLGGCSAHPDNWYCRDTSGCGWRAWEARWKAETKIRDGGDERG